MSRLLVLGVTAVLAVGPSACGRADTVTIDVLPAPGTVVSYEIALETVVRTEIDGSPSTEVPVSLEVPVRYEYGKVTDEVVGVSIYIDDEAEPLRVRLDALGRIQSIVGQPPSDMLGPADLFPAGVGVPEGPLRPGQRWSFRYDTLLPDVAGPVTVTGTGWLERLHIVDGVESARLVSTSGFDIVTSTAEVVLDGRSESKVTVDISLATGRLMGATAISTGSFDLSVPDDPSVSGTVSVTATSSTSRI